MKRVLSFALAVVFLSLACTVLFSCGSDGSQALSFWAYQPTTQEDQNDYKALLAKFTEETGIAVKVNFVNKDNYNTAFSSALLSSKKPDVAYLDQPLVAYYADSKTLYDMTDAIEKSETLSTYEYFEGARETTVYQGKTYAVPLNITTSVLFVNRDLVQEEIRDWAQWLSVGNTLTGNKALFEGIGSAGYAAWYFQVFLANNGGTFLNADGTEVTFNDEKGFAAAKMLQDLYKLSNKNTRETDNAFGRGMIATKLGSSSDIETIGTAFPDLDFTAQLVPPQTAGTSYSNIGGENLVVLQSSAQKDRAMKLVEFLMKEESSKELCRFSGNFSAVKRFAQVEKGDPYFGMKQTVLEQLNTACARPAVPGWLTVNDDYLGTALESILGEKADESVVRDKLNVAASQAANVLFK